MKKLLDSLGELYIELNSLILSGNSTKGYTLYTEGIQRMFYEPYNQIALREQQIFQDYAHGDCIISGLGFGLIIETLLEKEEVKNITVYEINEDVIKLYEMLGIKHHKLKIIKENINKVVNKNCDCLFLDHYELESDDFILNSVKNINFNIKPKILWFWKAENYIMYYMNSTKKKPKEAYEQFKKENNLFNMPQFSEDQVNKYIDNWINLYRR